MPAHTHRLLPILPLNPSSPYPLLHVNPSSPYTRLPLNPSSCYPVAHAHAYPPPFPQDTYFTMLTQLRMVEQQTTVQAAAVAAADHGQLTLLGGKLAATLAAAVKAVFVPDVTDQHVEQAKTVLVGGQRGVARIRNGGSGGGEGGRL